MFELREPLSTRGSIYSRWVQLLDTMEHSAPIPQGLGTWFLIMWICCKGPCFRLCLPLCFLDWTILFELAHLWHSQHFLCLTFRAEDWRQWELWPCCHFIVYVPICVLISHHSASSILSSSLGFHWYILTWQLRDLLLGFTHRCLCCILVGSCKCHTYLPFPWFHSAFSPAIFPDDSLFIPPSSEDLSPALFGDSPRKDKWHLCPVCEVLVVENKNVFNTGRA